MTDYRNRITALEYVASKDLTPHPGNWRNHGKAQTDALKGVLAEVGISGALLAYHSERNGGKLTVIDGHLRKDAAPQTWPVLVLDVDDAEADYLLAVHDPLSAMATADAAALDALLSSVNSGEAAVQAMLAELAKEAGLYGEPVGDDPGAQIDKAEELRQKWGTATGQLWALGEHRIIVGDCRDAAVVGRVMGGEKAGAIVADPPYGIGADKRNAHSSIRDNPKWADVEWDKKPTGDYIRTILESSQKIAIWGGNYFTDVLPVSSGWLAWVKPQYGTGFSLSDMELCWTNLNIGPRCKEFPRRDGNDHPTQKPVSLIVWTIEKISGDNESIYDPFLGSGTTLIACEQLKRRCRGVEISPAYVAVTLERWATMTGKTPELLP